MEHKISASDRLTQVLEGEKFFDLDSTANILAGEILSVCRDYLQLEGNVVVRYKKQGDKMIFTAEMQASRVKPFRYINS